MSGSAPPTPPARRRSIPRWLKIAAPVVATVVVLAPLAYLWQASLVPDVYSVMDMGRPDYGGGPRSVHDHADHSGSDDSGGHGSAGNGHQTFWVPDLIEKTNRRADVRHEFTAKAANVQIGAKTVAGFTLNDQTPGPWIEARQGQLIEVMVRNESVPAGVSLHWHGLNVPNAMDGVAGVTQNAVRVGESYTYRFVAEQVGTYWYHSHQVSHAQVVGGLFGALVVRPKAADEKAEPGDAGPDVTAVAHTYGGIRTLNGKSADEFREAQPGQRARVRVINTDNAPMEVWANAPYRVVAVDGTDVHGPTTVTERAVTLTAGGRVDLAVTMPDDGSTVRVQLSKATAVTLGRPGVQASPPAQPPADLDLLTYGKPAALGIDPERADRRFDYVVGRIPGFVRGRPGMWWSINGQLYPNVPMYVVREGEVARMRIENRSGEVHPMHLHGHRALVLSRNGVAATGSPWWIDSLDVKNGETYDIAFQADNPGIWMDHCHNLQHAAEGMVAHLMYEGVDTPYRIGGEHTNQPE